MFGTTLTSAITRDQGLFYYETANGIGVDLLIDDGALSPPCFLAGTMIETRVGTFPSNPQHMAQTA